MVNWSSNSVRFMNMVTAWFPAKAKMIAPRAAKSPILTYLPIFEGGDGLSADSVYKRHA